MFQLAAAALHILERPSISPSLRRFGNTLEPGARPSAVLPPSRRRLG